MNFEQWFIDAKEAIERLEEGTKFCVKDLFEGTKWGTLSPGEKRSFGRYFSNALKDGNISNIERNGESKIHSNKYIKL